MSLKIDPESEEVTEEQYEACCEDMSRAFDHLKLPIPAWNDRPQEYNFEEQALAVIKARP